MADMRPRRGKKRSEQEAGEADAAQHQRFVETARALGCDEDEAAFKAKLAVIGRQKPRQDMNSAKANHPASSKQRK